MRRSLIFSLALTAFFTQAHADDAPCTALTSVFNLTEPSQPGELAVHTQLWFNSSELKVHASISFPAGSLPANTSYSFTVWGPFANYSVPAGVGGDFTVLLRPDGTGDVSLALHYNATDENAVTIQWDIDALRVSFASWVPTLNTEPNTDNYTCSGYSSNGAGCQSWSCVATGSADTVSRRSPNLWRNVEKCTCCGVDRTALSDFHTCPIRDLIVPPDGGNAAHVPLLLGYLLVLCMAISAVWRTLF